MSFQTASTTLAQVNGSHISDGHASPKDADSTTQLRCSTVQVVKQYGTHDPNKLTRGPCRRPISLLKPKTALAALTSHNTKNLRVRGMNPVR